MDGAGTLTVFTRIILPMCTPILATVGIFSAVNQWGHQRSKVQIHGASELIQAQFSRLKLGVHDES